MNFKSIRKEIENLKKLLDLKPGHTLEDLIKKIENFFGIEIFLEAAGLPNCVSGFCTVVDGVYLIQYDQHLTKKERRIVIGHELGHIINRDVSHKD